MEYDPFVLGQLRRLNSLAFPVSSVSGQGLDALRQAMADHFVLPMCRLRLRLPPDRFDLVGLAHREGQVLSQHHQDASIVLEVNLPARFLDPFKPYID
jgi:GTP-binding protein HflX